ncbi:hypothetical protein [Shimazuella kribbensis]|uniref:hypothetical protein n=1 Tax=Shimazuella kribbensis TaxID=139808 RepID=UPI000414E326|nr:hypothetical protein [Shimazuella kribbensis]
MRKLIGSIVIFLILYSIFASIFSDEPTSKANFSNKNLIKTEEMPTFYTKPDKFKDRSIVIYGKIFNVLSEKLQIYSDPDLANDVFIKGKTDQWKEDEYVKVSGVVVGDYEYENSLDNTLHSPMITATKIEKSDYITAFYPTIKTIQVKQEKNQFETKIKVERVELAEKQTRVYLKITNDSKNTFRSYVTHLIQNRTQYKVEQKSFDPKTYKTLPYENLPGTVADGVIVFPAIDFNQPFTIHMEGYSNNTPQSFDVNVKNEK